MFLRYEEKAPNSEGFFMFRAAEGKAACVMEIRIFERQGLLATPVLPFDLPGVLPRFYLENLIGDWAFIAALDYEKNRIILDNLNNSIDDKDEKT